MGDFGTTGCQKRAFGPTGFGKFHMGQSIKTEYIHQTLPTLPTFGNQWLVADDDSLRCVIRLTDMMKTTE